MTKIITCPECGEREPVRDDAKVCSPGCRVKAWRRKKRAAEVEALEMAEEQSDG